MELTVKRAEYLLRVAKAAQGGSLPLDRTSDGCQECGYQINEWTPDQRAEHIYAKLGDEEFMVIGCEGYWFVDPTLVGLPRENWQDWQTNG